MENNISDEMRDAILLYQSNDLDRAEKIYNRILKKNPLDHRALHLLGLLKNRKGKRYRGKQLIKKAISINPDIPSYYNNLGEIYRDDCDYDKAVLNYKKAISINSEYAQAYNNLGCALIDAGEFKEAIKNFNNAVLINRNYAEAYNNIGAAYLKTEDPVRAIESLKKAIALKSDYVDAYYNIGNALKSQGN